MIHLKQTMQDVLEQNILSYWIDHVTDKENCIGQFLMTEQLIFLTIRQVSGNVLITTAVCVWN